MAADDTAMRESRSSPTFGPSKGNLGGPFSFLLADPQTPKRPLALPCGMRKPNAHSFTANAAFVIAVIALLGHILNRFYFPSVLSQTRTLSVVHPDGAPAMFITGEFPNNPSVFFNSVSGIGLDLSVSPLGVPAIGLRNDQYGTGLRLWLPSDDGVPQIVVTAADGTTSTLRLDAQLFEALSTLAASGSSQGP